MASCGSCVDPFPLRRATLLLVSAALAALAGCAPRPPGVAPEPEAERVVRVRIVHTNDFHGRLLPQPGTGAGPVGGSAVLAAHFDSARARFDGPTLLLSAGDDLQGTAVSNLSWGRAVVDVQNRKRYDAAALGNHEFDWGLDTLRARVADSRFPWLAANLYETATGRHPAWAQPWVLIERDGVRVGVIGLAQEQTPELVMAGITEGLEFRSSPEAVDRYAAEARAAGADFVVVVAHEGVVCREPGSAPTEPSAGCEGRLADIARQVRVPVDLFLGGHTHLRNFTDASGVPVMQALRFGEAFSLVDLERRGGETRILYRAILPASAAGVDPDTAVARVVADWEEALRPVSERVITELAEPLDHFDRQPGEFPLGSLLADAQRLATGADVGFVNVGGIRRGLPRGPVTFGMLFELQPFQNDMVVVELSGALLRETLELALGPDGRPRVHLSGLRVEYDSAAPAGHRIQRLILDDGRVLGPADPVTVGTTSFVAAGGDGYVQFRQGLARPTGLLDLDVLIQHLQSLPRPVAAPVGSRWRATRSRRSHRSHRGRGGRPVPSLR
jgi:2',3'-cyclic-nucleotide 2'-phosphodiesterase (5'-nucleotidase family)